MAKYHGVIGYAIPEETKPGIWEEHIVEHIYNGDSLRIARSLQSSGGVNDDVNISNQISIVADPFATENFCMMRYAEYMGAKWKVTNIEVQHPRLILTLGGIYNE